MPLERDQIMHDAPLCLVCRYDLTGFGVGDVCPECGNRIEMLYETPEVTDLAGAALFCGIGSLVCLGFAWVVPAAAGLGMPLACFGVVFAMIGRWRFLRAPSRYGRASWVRARVGFWLCVPGVVATGVLIAFVVSVPGW